MTEAMTEAMTEWELSQTRDSIASGALQERSDVAALRHRAKAMVAAYFGSWGVQDPDVLSLITRRMLDRAESKLALLGPEAYVAQLRLAAVECCDSYMEAWITSFEKQIDRHGGSSRCAELAVRLPQLLNRFPEAILSTDSNSEALRQWLALTAPAQPPNNPTKFAAQPLLGERPSIWNACRHGLIHLFRLFRRQRALDV